MCVCPFVCMPCVCLLPSSICFSSPFSSNIICPLSFCFCYCSFGVFFSPLFQCCSYLLSMVCFDIVCVTVVVCPMIESNIRGKCDVLFVFHPPSIVYFNSLLCREFVCVWDWVVTVTVVAAVIIVKVRSLSVYEAYHFTKDTHTYLQLTRRVYYKFGKKKKSKLQNSSTYENKVAYFACVYSLKQRYLHFHINYILYFSSIHLTLSLFLFIYLSHSFTSFYSYLFLFFCISFTVDSRTYIPTH